MIGSKFNLKRGKCCLSSKTKVIRRLSHFESEVLIRRTTDLTPLKVEYSEKGETLTFELNFEVSVITPFLEILIGYRILLTVIHVS